MDKNFFRFKWILLLAVFLMGQFFLISSAYAEWTVVDPPDVSSTWELFNPRYNWAVGQDSENMTGVLLYFSYGSWIRATLPNVSSDWALSGVDLTSPTGGWAVGQDFENMRGVLLYFTNPLIATLPTLTTTPISDITATTATGGGNITSAGNTPVTARGVCWSTSANPTVDVEGSTCTTDGTGTGEFTSSITGLTPSTQYHVRAYATNSVGTGYGDDLTFSTIASTTTLAAATTLPINITATADSGSNLVWLSRSVTPPNVSSDWGLSAVHFVSSDLGWAVGQDWDNGKGVILLFSEGVWTSVMPPNVSSYWGLSAVHFRWAVGQDWDNGRGVILDVSGGSWTSIMPPKVSSDWGLSAVQFLSSDEAWAVGQDFENGRGVLLHFSGGSWKSVMPPNVSPNWGLSSVDFISPNEGWAVGKDFENKRGVLLHFVDHSWTSVSPPDVSSDWGLSGIHLFSPNGGWAVGKTSDGSNLQGVLIRYTVPKISVSPMNINFNDVEIGALLEKTVTVKNTGNGNLIIGTITAPSPPFYISADSCSGKSLAWLQACKVTYRFLPDAAGTFSSNSNIDSNGSSSGFDQKTVTLNGTGKAGTLNYIHLLEPSDGEIFTACDYSNPPKDGFKWESSGTFTSIEVQFYYDYDFSRVPLKVKGDPNVNQLIIKPNVWKRILLLPGADGGTLNWMVVAKKKDRTMVQGKDVFSGFPYHVFDIFPPDPVDNLHLSHTSKTTLPPPTISWENAGNCNVMFTVWFGNDSDFKNPNMKKMPISYRIKDSDGFQETFKKELTSGQWNSIRKLGGDVTGATLYWYVESRDTLGRRQSTDVMSFVLTD